MTLQPALPRCPPAAVLQAILLEVAAAAAATAASAGRALGGVAEPAPAKPQDLLHVKVLLPRHPPGGLETKEEAQRGVPKNMKESKGEKKKSLWFESSSSSSD